MPEKSQNNAEINLDLPESAPIGVFDSGIGGLTVLNALMNHFPQENFIYLGDTARLPYGTKSPETIIKYAESLTRVLLARRVKAIVVACSTASAHALPAVRQLAAPLPVIGMIDPTAQAAMAATRNNHIAVMATAGTVRSKIYETTLHELNPDVRVSSVPCQMLVALAEEGWAYSGIAKQTLEAYVSPLLSAKNKPDTVILGCTHFPLFIPLLKEILGADVTLINSGEVASHALAAALPVVKMPRKTKNIFLATDDPIRFAEGAGKFFTEHLAPEDIALVDVTYAS